VPDEININYIVAWDEDLVLTNLKPRTTTKTIAENILTLK